MGNWTGDGRQEDVVTILEGIRAAGAVSYQRELASRAAAPVRAARLAWAMAERPLAAALGVGLARRVPPALAWLMNASRVAASTNAPPRPCWAA